jgi:hypothetical protein
MVNDTDWDHLVGLHVRIQTDGRTFRTGQVEAVTAGTDGLWVSAHRLDSRALYEKAEGYTVLPLQTTQKSE